MGFEAAIVPLPCHDGKTGNTPAIAKPTIGNKGVTWIESLQFRRHHSVA